MKIVVFCYRRGISLSVPIRCFFPRKDSIQITILEARITIAIVNYYGGSDLLCVVFLVPQGPMCI